MRYAIVQSGGKQYKVVEGSTIEVDRLDVDEGKKLTLDDILLVADGENVMVGAPMVKDAKVSATVVSQFKGPKVVVFKYHPRKRYRLKRGHRQYYTRLLIESVEAKGMPNAAPTQEAVVDELAEVQKTEAKAQAPKKQATKAAAKPAAKKEAPKAKASAKPAAKKEAPKKEEPSTRRKLSGFEALTANTVEMLEGAGISSVSQLLKALKNGDDEVLAINGIGPKGLADLKKALKKEGYSLSK